MPKFELYEEGSQIRRSSKAVTSLIVEGYSRRRYKAEFIKYLVYAHAENEETIVHVEFLFETESLRNKEMHQSLYSRYGQLSKQLATFIEWVDKNWNDLPNKNDPKT